ncbi:hypothetical protein BDD12DRAFT_828546 [Trichophaea hybrida]|nr:hypothetical protein BDD12DRAFT_828546 [Trichophaea hybrida]
MVKLLLQTKGCDIKITQNLLVEAAYINQQLHPFSPCLVFRFCILTSSLAVFLQTDSGAEHKVRPLCPNCKKFELPLVQIHLKFIVHILPPVREPAQVCELDRLIHEGERFVYRSEHMLLMEIKYLYEAGIETLRLTRPHYYFNWFLHVSSRTSLIISESERFFTSLSAGRHILPG